MPQLFAHQIAASQWLTPANQGRFGLFDEPGLGKTAAAISAATSLDGRHRILVVAPVVVTHNWRREFHTWAPRLAVQVLGTGRDEISDFAQVVVVPHSLLIADKVFAQLVARRWSWLIVDEAHAFKNPQAKRTKKLYRLGAQLNLPALTTCAERTTVLTGTPMPNNPTELWTMLAGLDRRRLADGNRPMNWYQFRERFCVLERSPFTPDGVKVVGTQNVDELKQRLQGFALRRLKKDVLDLPPIRWGSMTVTADTIPKALRDIEAEITGGRTLPPEALLVALKDSAQFSTFRRLCGLAKAPAAAEVIASHLQDTGEKVVVFCHHREVGDILAQDLAQFGVARISGDQNAAARSEAVDRFQTDSTCRVAVCQIVAGGVGVTLTAAHTVFFVEQSFVPGENVQGADRCHRIGQRKPVQVIVLLLANSIDELVGDILTRKTQMIREILS